MPQAALAANLTSRFTSLLGLFNESLANNGPLKGANLT